MTSIQQNRALASLQGLALGDALGMPTQSMSPVEIQRFYGEIHRLTDAVPEQSIAPSMPAGAITDDTEQALLLAHLLINGHGHIDPRALADSLIAWETDMIARGSFDLLGPSTKLALEKVRAGEDPRTTGSTGTTNGAAMRVAPVGIAYPFGNPTALGDAVHESCMVTHDTRQGWEGATLVAAAASAGVDGYSTRDAVVAAIELVESLPERGHWAAKASVLARSKEAVRGIRHRTGAEQLDYLRDVVGTSVDSTESVPAALAIAYEFADDPMTGLYTAANLGGDTDTIAAMAGAIFGATHGTAAFDMEAVRTVEEVSHLELRSIRDGLLELRAGRL